MEKFTKKVEMILIEKEENHKPVEFTSIFNQNMGWISTTITPKYYKRIIYLGNCDTNGDMFCTYENGSILIYKGHLNSGKY